MPYRNNSAASREQERDCGNYREQRPPQDHQEQLNDPAFYEKMSALLDEIMSPERQRPSRMRDT